MKRKYNEKKKVVLERARKKYMGSHDGPFFLGGK